MGSWGHCTKKKKKNDKIDQKSTVFGWKSNLFGETFNLTQH